MKRFRDIDYQLLGGEKTVAACTGTSFAIHRCARSSQSLYPSSNTPAAISPRPFFIPDEVDNTLDNTNVPTIANYIRMHVSDTYQFFVISLKALVV